MNMYLTIYKIHFTYKEQDIFSGTILYDFVGYRRIKNFEFNITENTEKYIYLNAENNSITITNNLLNTTDYHIAYLKIKRVNNNIEILESPDSSLMYFTLQDDSIYIRHLNQEVLNYIQTTAQNTVNNNLSNLTVNIPNLGQDVLDYIQTTAQNTAQNIVNNSSFNVSIITGNYNININDDYLICDNSTNITLTLPTITQNTRKKVITIKKVNSGNVTIQTSSNQLIDRNVTSFTLIDDGQLIRLLPVNETIGWVIV